MYWGVHNAFVYKFFADVEYNVKVKYRTPYGKIYFKLNFILFLF